MKTIYVVFNLIFFTILILSCSQIQSDHKASTNTDSTLKAAKDSSRVLKERMFHDFLTLQIETIESDLPGQTDKSTTDLLMKELLLFNSWVEAIKKADTFKTGDFKILGEKLKTLAIKAQRSEFPKMREAHGKITASAMWEHDIYVNTSGNRNVYLNMTGGFFASNANIKETEGIIEAFAIKLRFKQIRYRWYKGASEYTYYNLDSPADDSLLIVN